MFRIREEQMAQLGANARTRFVARMAEYLRQEFARDAGAIPELEAWVGRCVGKADRYGVKREPEVAQLLLLFLVLGADADETKPWFREALADRDLAGLGKVRKLIHMAQKQRIEGLERVLVVREVNKR